MLISTVKLTTQDAITMYYTRNQIEEIFGICKGDSGKLLPINVDTEKAFRGHLLISFITSIILLLLREKLSALNMTVESALTELSHHQGLVYSDAIVPSLTAKEMNAIYNLFKIKCPDEIPIRGTAAPFL